MGVDHNWKKAFSAIQNTCWYDFSFNKKLLESYWKLSWLCHFWFHVPSTIFLIKFIVQIKRKPYEIWGIFKLILGSWNQVYWKFSKIVNVSPIGLINDKIFWKGAIEILKKGRKWKEYRYFFFLDGAIFDPIFAITSIFCPTKMVYQNKDV